VIATLGRTKPGDPHRVEIAVERFRQEFIRWEIDAGQEVESASLYLASGKEINFGVDHASTPDHFEQVREIVRNREAREDGMPEEQRHPSVSWRDLYSRTRSLHEAVTVSADSVSTNPLPSAPMRRTLRKLSAPQGSQPTLIGRP
jgi:hypothetical protein